MLLLKKRKPGVKLQDSSRAYNNKGKDANDFNQTTTYAHQRAITSRTSGKGAE